MRPRTAAPFAVAAVATLLAATVHAQGPSPPDSAKMRPPAPALKPAGREKQLAVGGFVQAQGEFGDKGDSRYTNGNDRLYLRRTRLTATAQFAEHFEAKVELDLSASLAAASGLRAQLTDGYAAWTRYPELVVRAGQFKVPFGYEVMYSDTKLAVIERTLASDRIGIGRQPGVQVSGDLAEKRVAYALGAFDGTSSNTSGNDNDKFLGAFRLGLTPWRQGSGASARSVGIGGNVYYSDDAAAPQPGDFRFDSTPATPAADDVFAGQRLGLGGDAQLAAGPLELWGEYLHARFDPTDGLPRPRVSSEGWYAQAMWAVVRDRVQTVVRFEAFDPDRAVDANTTESWTLGVNYFIAGHDLKLMGDYVQSHVPGIGDAEQKLLTRLQIMF